MKAKAKIVPDLKWTDADGDRGWLTVDDEPLPENVIAILSAAEHDDGGAWRSVYLTRENATELRAWLQELLEEQP